MRMDRRAKLLFPRKDCPRSGCRFGCVSFMESVVTLRLHHQLLDNFEETAATSSEACRQCVRVTFTSKLSLLLPIQRESKPLNPLPVESELPFHPEQFSVAGATS